VALSGGDGDDTAGTTTVPTTPTTADDDTTTTTDDEATSTTESTESTASSGSTSETLAPLPGDDWNPDARAAFIDGCASDPSFGAVGTDPDDMCGCIYDQLEADGADFDAVNEQWVLEDADPSSPAMQAMFSATTTCALSGG
jgi:hypothetical protein